MSVGNLPLDSTPENKPVLRRSTSVEKTNLISTKPEEGILNWVRMANTRQATQLLVEVVPSKSSPGQTPLSARFNTVAPSGHLDQKKSKSIISFLPFLSRPQHKEDVPAHVKASGSGNVVDQCVDWIKSHLTGEHQQALPPTYRPHTQSEQGHYCFPIDVNFTVSGKKREIPESLLRSLTSCEAITHNLRDQLGDAEKLKKKRQSQLASDLQRTDFTISLFEQGVPFDLYSSSQHREQLENEMKGLKTDLIKYGAHAGSRTGKIFDKAMGWLDMLAPGFRRGCYSCDAARTPSMNHTKRLLHILVSASLSAHRVNATVKYR